MKHQSFYNEYSAIAAKEIAELRRCLKEHGGSFSWQDNVKIDEPIITVGLDNTGWTGDVRILKVWIEKNGNIRLLGVQNDSGCEVEFNLDEVHYSHIEFIMDYLPEVPKDMHGKLIKVGAKVKWQDPAINDYEPKDRDWVLNRIFEVSKIYYCDDNDPQIYLSEVNGNSEAEAWAHEVEIVEVKEEKTLTYKEAENLAYLSADLMEWLSQDALSYRFGDSRERVSFLREKAKQFEERLDHKDEDEGNYDYMEELEKFEKEIKDEVVADIPLPF